jgi:hypothetical protein
MTDTIVAATAFVDDEAIESHIAACPACDRLLGSGFAGCAELRRLEGRS